MSEIVNWIQQLPEPDRLALSTRYVLLKALLEATHTRAKEIQPEHLLLGLIKQNDARMMRMSDALGLDLVAIYRYLEPPGRLVSSRSSFFKERPDLEQRAYQEWLQPSHEEYRREFKAGDVVKGIIVHIDRDKILVNIGLELEGILPTKELPATGYGSFDELHLNDKVLVYVIQTETPHGRVLLSLKQALIKRSWWIAKEQYRNGVLLKARVIDYGKGGLYVDVSGIRGFVPLSQILNLTPEDIALGDDNQETMVKLQKMMGKEIHLKIVEIDPERNRLILSERLAFQEWRLRRREELLDELKPGEIRRGVVSNIANFGIFVDLGGAEGLVHVSQLAWRRVNHPGELFKVGQEVEVQVLSVDKEKKKIALSIKRDQVDPWKTVEQRYKVGQVVTGTITKIAPFGVFASIEDGVEGLIRMPELTSDQDETNLHEGQHLQMRILSIDTERRHLSLSLRQVDEMDVDEVSTNESGEIKHVDDAQLSSYKETLKAEQFTTSPGAGEAKESLPFSQESLECLDWALSFAKHIHSTLTYPDHLLLSVLLQKRIQSFLAPLLPSSEALLAYFTGGITPGTQTESSQASTCPSCKQATFPGWKHCVYCGTSLARVCPKCGAPYPDIEGARFCFECGEPLKE